MADIEPRSGEPVETSPHITVNEKAPEVYQSSDHIGNDEPQLLGPEPTEEELLTLRKVSDRLPLSAWCVAIVELAERFTYYGCSGVFQNYMQKPRIPGPQPVGTGKPGPGGLGLGNAPATALNYFFQFWCYVTPVPMGLLADTLLGKYNTIFMSCIIYIIGTLVLFVTSLPVSLDHNHGLGGLISAMVIIGIGTGGIKANVSTLIADQYTNTKPYVRTLKSGERVIVDPAVTMQRVFMIFYMCINVGGLSSIATTELERNVDFWAAYLLPFCFFFLALTALVLGRKFYIRRPPQGSPVPHAFRIAGIVISNGLKKTGYHPTKAPSEHETARSNALDRGITKFTSFLGRPFRTFNFEVAKPSVRSQLGLPSVPWTDLFVDEVERTFVACKVFLFFPIYWVCYGQMLSNFVSQAGQMDTHKIPNDIMQNIDPFAIILFIPVMDYLVYPVLRKMGFKMYPITRIFLGFVLASVAMGYAAICQHIIYTSPPCYKYPTDARCMNVPGSGITSADEGLNQYNFVHVAVQTPAYLFIALSEIFASITGLEYAYTKSPVTMKSFIMSLYLLTNAFGSALGVAISPTAENPKLMWMYIGLAIATIIAGGLFWVFYSRYNKTEELMNNIDADAVAEDNLRRFGDKIKRTVPANHSLRPEISAQSRAYSGFDAHEAAALDARGQASNI